MSRLFRLHTKKHTIVKVTVRDWMQSITLNSILNQAYASFMESRTGDSATRSTRSLSTLSAAAHVIRDSDIMTQNVFRKVVIFQKQGIKHWCHVRTSKDATLQAVHIFQDLLCGRPECLRQVRIPSCGTGVLNFGVRRDILPAVCGRVLLDQRRSSSEQGGEWALLGLVREESGQPGHKTG